ncbi:hypothetical protein PVOR_00375 [Paenibacillus vortex V453]|jgi:hypothetical protein|uniref:YdhG-like domain-containing protein n=2 Tax=Paenibacillus TaxID=44249 RepID=A0A163IGP2_9BACL|nr:MULTISPECIES: DUF1801 domain-containing protein [Paenibacillus]ANA79931.1 hypothetical protein A3958_08060 [Paenibacillus glucanolyticus]AVV56045.1 DUF1801 domain-containing protein [Paenibacillus glucanolyticus]AWP30579.1 hypothetical protein B9D94_29980 [Paenibacillus sp. Cedars]EFU43641.1 hypothetical protein PVOR_00375 [Paenibacillus vortex V453]ETT38314.1 hypothetical protein C169_11907 [Paenibacillus sp. FSL R5-808]
MNQEVTDYIAAVNDSWKVEVSERLRELVHSTIPGVAERLQYKKPHFLKNGKYAAVISISKTAVSFTIFNATGLDWPQPLFEGPPERKTIKITAGQQVDYDALASLLKQASEGL